MHNVHFQALSFVLLMPLFLNTLFFTFFSASVSIYFIIFNLDKVVLYSYNLTHLPSFGQTGYLCIG